MIKARLFIDEPVGERRRVLLDTEGRPFRIDVERWSERDARARVGETWAGRLVAQGADGDWQVDLGPGGQAALRSDKQAALVSGGRLPVRVFAEAYGDKGAVVRAVQRDTSPGDKSGRLEAAADDAFLDGVDIIETVAGASARSVVDAAIEEAMSASIQLAGGGRIWVETTRALTAIDVDRSASRQGAHALNLVAAEAAARQAALRGVGGLLIVDFIGAPRKAKAAELAARLTHEAQAYAALRIDSLGLSRFGLLQAAIPRRRRSLNAALKCGAEEREALDALRGIEDLGRSHRAARIEAALSVAAERWLRSTLPDWETQLGDRIGQRWRLVAGDRPVGPPQLRIME